MNEVFATANQKATSTTTTSAVSRYANVDLQALVSQDHWHGYYLELDRAHGTLPTDNDTNQEAPQPTANLFIGANGESDEEDDDEDDDEDDLEEIPTRDRKRERRVDPQEEQKLEQGRLKRVRFSRTEDQHVQSVLENVHDYIQRVPNELLHGVLLEAFLPTSADLPGFSKPRSTYGDFPTGGWYTPMPRSGTVDVRPRRWGWQTVSEMAFAFVFLYDRVRSPITARFLRDPHFARDLWRRWLDGYGAHSREAGRCTRAAVPQQTLLDNQERWPITDTHWFTHGFLPSVVLHRSLLNSARNVLATRDLVAHLTEYIQQVSRYQPTDHLKMTHQSPEWINAWMAGDEPTPHGWELVKHVDRWNGGWFASQLAHGFLTLDFMEPKTMDVESIEGFYHTRGQRLLQHIRNDVDIRSRKDINQAPYPVVIRLPKLLIGDVLGAGAQIVWGPAGNDQTDPKSKSWVRIPVSGHNDPDASPYSMAPNPLLTAGSLILSGVMAPGPERAPRVGLVLPDELKFDVLNRYAESAPPIITPPTPPPEVVESLRNEAQAHDLEDDVLSGLMTLAVAVVQDDSDESDESEDDLESLANAYTFDKTVAGRVDDASGIWYESIMNVWVADIRIDSPESFLALLSRVGSRYGDAIEGSAWEDDPAQLGGDVVSPSMIKPVTRQSHHMGIGGSQYLDGKNIILARCWMPKAESRWLRERTPDPDFFDDARGIWVVDVGDATGFVDVLVLNRCYGGPALPTVVPDLRMRILYYGVPVYRVGNSFDADEDIPRIINHGRLDRILLTPRTQFVLDRVAFSNSFFDNAEWWMAGQIDTEVPPQVGAYYVPAYGWLQGTVPDDVSQGPQPYPASQLHYRFKDMGQVLEPEDLTKEEGHESMAETFRRVFGAPLDGDKTRTNLETAFILFSHITDQLGAINTITRDLQWTNILFAPPYGDHMGERGPELNPVQDLLRALDEAGDGLTARNVWLTLHPTLRKIPDLGARVDWSRVAFGTFTPGESRQLSIRLGMTTFPQRMVMGQPLAFMDQLRLPGVRLHYQSERQYALIDFRYNALDGTEETTDVLDEFDEMYPARRSRIRFLIAGNPLALETQDQDVGSTIFERRHLDIIQADRRSQPYIYEPPINTNQTIGYGGAVWEGTDARRANPYGGTLNDGGLDTLVN